MSFNGSGTYTLPGAALNTGDTVSATENNTLRNDMATAFNKTLCRDGQATPTANLPMGGFKLTGLAAGTASGESVRYDEFNALNTSNFGFRNRIINGAMMIDQRGSASSPTNVNGAYSVDRFFLSKGGSGVFTLGQSTTAPSGFKNSLVATVTTSATVGSTDYYDIGCYLEGNNTADFGWGTASASTVSFSFWVRSSVTGVYSFELRNGAANRSITYNYTIAAANTWQQVTQTIVGDTTGTWATDNTSGIQIIFPMATGSNYTTATTGTWQAGNYNASTSAVTTWPNTVGNTFYITGVQLEKGSTATSFDYRPYSTELALCQRYACVIPSTGSGLAGPVGSLYGSTAGRVWYKHPVTMRASPTFTATSNNFSIVAVGTGTGTVANYQYSTEITTFDGTSLSFSGSAGNSLVFGGGGIISAEL